MKKIVLVLLFSVLLFGCNNSKVENKTIIENIVLNQSTFNDVKEVLPDMERALFVNENGFFDYSDIWTVNYTINNVDGKLSLDFSEDSDNKLLYVHFSPKDYSKESGDKLKTWLLNKYSDYEQTTKDTGYIFSNGNENVELYITENPIDDTQYYGLYIEWTIVE